MAGFDDYFAKKLDEERSFPRRERNWRAVRKRLAARDPKQIPEAGNGLAAREGRSAAAEQAVSATASGSAPEVIAEPDAARQE